MGILFKEFDILIDIKKRIPVCVLCVDNLASGYSHYTQFPRHVSCSFCDRSTALYTYLPYLTFRAVALLAREGKLKDSEEQEDTPNVKEPLE